MGNRYKHIAIKEDRKGKKSKKDIKITWGYEEEEEEKEEYVEPFFSKVIEFLAGVIGWFIDHPISHPAFWWMVIILCLYYYCC